MKVLRKKDWKAGDLILLTSGEYSGLCVSSLMRVTRDFSMTDAQEEVNRLTVNAGRIGHMKPYSKFHFQTWLEETGRAEEVAYTEINNDCDLYVS